MCGIIFGFTNQALGQACPACSNPALQSSEKLEAGTDTLHKGDIRFTLNATNGLNYQGGHPNWKGLTHEEEVIGVPLHHHIVDLDFVRTELSLEYTFKTNWSLWLRIPFDVKMQEATIEFTEPATGPEQELMLRNRDIHHRNETYTGLSDFRLLAAHRINKFITEKARIDIALGTSLPVGRTEENPLTAGRAGQKHMHIQFGTGTFDPLAELHFVTALTKKWSLGLFTINRFPFYENKKAYKPPIETTNGAGLGYRVKDWLLLRFTLANFVQGRARWAGEIDPNSGLVAFNGNISPTFRLNNGLLITPGYRFPVYQRTLSSEGDVFKYGPTFLLNVSYLVKNK